MKVFEDYFTELQADMVAVALEYVENRAEKIYILCSYEDNVITGSWFYQLNGKIVDSHRLNDVIKQGEKTFDVSVPRQQEVNEIINHDIEEIGKLCKKYNREIPTQIKLIYDICNNSLNADFTYDLVYSNIPGKAWHDVFEEWFEEIKKNQ